MKRIRTHQERLFDKSMISVLTSKLKEDYSLSPMEAKTLTEDIAEFLDRNSQKAIKEGQILYSAVDESEPAGKALKDCKTRLIKLTVYPTDLIGLSFTNQKEYNQQLVERLCWEAYNQGCLLTQEDLARLLHCSVSTIRRILSNFRKQDILLPTRGNYSDIGPGISHKTHAIKKYLEGKTILEISKLMGHSVGSIERYINDFTLVYSAYVNEQFTSKMISKLTGLSKGLVDQYIGLYESLKDNPDYAHQLRQIRLRSEMLYDLIKKNRGMRS